MIVLDTHVLIWLVQVVDKLGKSALSLIAEATSNRQIHVSAITFWEIAMLSHKNRIRISTSVETLRAGAIANGMQEIPVDGEIGIRSINLTNFYPDPADRIIVATALAGYKLVTADKKILTWDGPLQCVDATH